MPKGVAGPVGLTVVTDVHVEVSRAKRFGVTLLKFTSCALS
jgi:hypothetical protein